MEESARLLPDNVNVKLILRHSFRPPLQGHIEHKNVRLTSAGISLAAALGRSIECIIGELHSSVIPRCIGTIESIMTDRNEKRTINLSEDILTDVFATNKKEADASFKKIGSLKQIVKMLQEHDKIPGFRMIEESVSMILNYIFQNSNEPNTLDIYCTHDLQLALLNSVLFSPDISLQDIKLEWPNMLEGMFFWGQRNDFYCAWRGKSKRFRNLLL